MTDAPQTIMQRLKAETNDLHSHAESRTLQRAIATGDVDRNSFTAYLGQLYHVHSSLETILEAHREKHPSIGAIASADRMRVPDLHRDLAFYGIDQDTLQAGDAAGRFSASVEEAGESNPVALLGALYVLEGSTNGGRFLAMSLRKSWNLANEGLSYFDPYGAEQPHKWAAFKEAMDQTSFEASDEEAMIEMAKATFLAISEVSDEISNQHQ